MLPKEKRDCRFEELIQQSRKRHAAYIKEREIKRKQLIKIREKIEAKKKLKKKEINWDKLNDFYGQKEKR